MKEYKHLTLTQRDMIYALYQEGFNQRKIPSVMMNLRNKHVDGLKIFSLKILDSSLA